MSRRPKCIALTALFLTLHAAAPGFAAEATPPAGKIPVKLAIALPRVFFVKPGGLVPMTPKLWGALPLTKQLHALIGQWVTEIVPDGKVEVSQKKLKVNPKEADTPDALAQAGRDLGVDYVVKIRITRKDWKFTAQVQLINSKNASIDMDFRSDYYNPDTEISDRALRIATTTLGKLEKLTGGTGAIESKVELKPIEIKPEVKPTVTGTSGAVAKTSTGAEGQGGETGVAAVETGGAGTGTAAISSAPEIPLGEGIIGHEPIGKAVAEVNGYLDNRFIGSWIHTQTLLPTQDEPTLSDLVEANFQLRVDLGNKTRFIYSDVSLFYQGGWVFYADDGMGGRRDVGNHDVPSLRPFVVPSELYLSINPEPWFNFLAGKRRLIWGSGYAFNPTDLINPPKDPTDPNFQRSGNWLARVETVFEKFTVTGLFAPEALNSVSGIPFEVFKYPTYAPADSTEMRDSQYHYLVAGRIYTLLFDSDVNLMYYFSNHYQNELDKKSRVGASFSRYFFTDYELHFDMLLTPGSPRAYPNGACFVPGATCPAQTAILPTKLDSSHVYPRLVVGTRRQFADDSTLSFEYFYQGDGDSDDEFQQRLQLFARAKAAGVAIATAPPPQVTGGLPQKFTFDPQRRHYFIGSFSKPRIFDDWTVGAVAVAGLRDLSLLFSPNVAWTPVEWLTLTLYGNVPIRAFHVGEAQVGNQAYNEYSLLPFDWRALFEARAFY